MHLEDLAPYKFPIGTPNDAVSVGWLENGHAFDVGTTPRKFRSKLRELARDIKNPMWGFHECDLCDGRGGKSKGNGEIHVLGSDGILYVAPELVLHYVSRHKYLPPQEFIDAVLTSDR